MNMQTIAFVGGGNMARSLVGGLVADGWPPNHIRVADPAPEQLDFIIQQASGVSVTANNLEAVDGADVVLFAVKPRVLKAAAIDTATAIHQSNTLVISIAAGVRSTDLARWLGGDVAVVRCMPNTPALVRSGATGLYANPEVTREQREAAERILRAVGLVVWFEDEDLLNAVTALSGSGPAYFLRVMEVIEDAGIRLGLNKEAARLLTLQTAFGTAKLALESAENIATLRQRVTSKGGTTERALAELQQSGIDDLFDRALRAAAERARELADELARD